MNSAGSGSVWKTVIFSCLPTAQTGYVTLPRGHLTRWTLSRARQRAAERGRAQKDHTKTEPGDGGTERTQSKEDALGPRVEPALEVVQRMRFTPSFIHSFMKM